MATKTLCDGCEAELVPETGCYSFHVDLHKLDGTPEQREESSVYVHRLDLCGCCAGGLRSLLLEFGVVKKANCPRPPMSLGLFYQMTGRCIRPHPDKDHAMVVDMVGLVEQFGKIEDLQIVQGPRGRWYVASRGRPLTNVFFGSPRR